MSEGHLLASAARLWNDVKGDFKETADVNAVQDGVIVAAEELRKVAKWLQQIITKFGASASVADGPDRDRALRPIAEDVIKAYTAAIGTLIALKKGAGASLTSELHEAGHCLADAIDKLGAAVGTPSLATAAAKVLDRCKHFERISTHNRAAIRRRLLTSLAQLRDANREMGEVLSRTATDVETTHLGAGDDDDDDDSFGGMDDNLDASERRVVDAANSCAHHIEEALKQASQACMPMAASPTAGNSGTNGAMMSAGLDELEVAVLHGAAAVHAIDSLMAGAIGGLDEKACEKAISELRAAADGLATSPPTAAGAAALRETLESADWPWASPL